LLTPRRKAHQLPDSNSSWRNISVAGHRVSTGAQDLTAQLKDLKAAGCERVFKEKITGASADRPQLKNFWRLSVMATW
jgi:hypothetical protein